MANLGSAYYSAGRIAEATALIEETIQSCRTYFGYDHPTTLIVLHTLALCHQAGNKTDLAVQLFEELVQRRKTRLGPLHRDTIRAILDLAHAYSLAGQKDKESSVFEELLAATTDKNSLSTPFALRAAINLPEWFRSSGRTDQAIEAYQKIFDFHRNKIRVRHAETNQAMIDFVDLCHWSDRPNIAIPYFRQDLALTRLVLKDNNFELRNILIDIGKSLTVLEKYVEAEAILRECTSISEKLYPTWWGTYESKALLGYSIFRQRRYLDAEPILVSAYNDMKGVTDKRQMAYGTHYHRNLFLTANRVMLFYWTTGQPQKAVQIRETLTNETAPSPREKR